MARITQKKVLEKISQFWPDADPAEIRDVLDGCGHRARIQLAVFKLCEGDRDQLPRLVEMANRDWWDVIAYAEYPEEMRTGLGMRALSKDEQKDLRERDRKQYLEWLSG